MPAAHAPLAKNIHGFFGGAFAALPFSEGSWLNVHAAPLVHLAQSGPTASSRNQKTSQLNPPRTASLAKKDQWQQQLTSPAQRNGMEHAQTFCERILTKLIQPLYEPVKLLSRWTTQGLPTLALHSLSSAMAGKRKRPSAQDEQANATDVVEDRHVLFTRIRLRYTTERRSLRYLICIRRARPGATSS